MSHFPDCEVFEMPQRSPEWFDVRRGIITASSVGAWILSEKTATQKKAREAAICDLVAGKAGAWESPTFENAAMKRGSEMEDEAVAAFEHGTGKKVREVGFCKSIHGLFGCSPDGLIVGESAGLEGKCPEGKAHIRYRRAGILPDQYKLQVHMTMAVTGATEWHFQSYHPGLVPLRVVVDRDAFTEELLAALKVFSKQAEIAIQEEANAWKAETVFDYEAWREANEEGSG